MAEYLAQADELFANGQIGTDDFKEAAQFMTQKKINPDDGFTFDAQAYEAAWKEAQDKVKRYFDNEDQFQSAENFLTDLQNVGLAIADGNNDFQWTENFNSSADAADKLGISVSAVEVLMHNLEAYGAEFNDMVWSGDELDQYKSALNGIKTIYDSMEEGATKDRYKKLIDGWDEELAGYENDLSTLTDHDVVVNIQFQYSLASIQQQIDELQNTADEGGDNQTWAELNASKKQYLKQAESANTSDVANLDAYKEAASYIDELKANLSNATDENTKNAIQRQISSVYDAMKYMNDAFIDSGKSWAEYYQSDQYKSDYKNFGDQLHANGVIDVDADTTKAKEKVDNLTEDTDNKSTTIDIDANIENAKTALENLKNDDGTDLVDALFNAISGVKSKTVSVGANVFGTGEVSFLASAIKGVVSKVVSVGANIFGFGKHKVNGTAHSLGTAYALGNWGAKESSTSLVGELGTEIVVDPATSTWRTVGDNGAEFVNIKKGQIVFNNRQSEELLKNGYVTSGGGRGKIQGGFFASGTALVLGNGSPGIHKNTGVMTSEKNKDKTSSSKSSSGSSSSGSSTRASSNSRSSSGGSSGGSSSSSDAKSTTEEVVDYIKILLSRLSRLSELATDAVDRAVGLVAKENQAADAISKLQNERAHNEKAAEMYLAKANSISLSDAYKNQLKNGSFNIETITDEDLKKKISDFQSYYESYLSARDNALKLEDKITELAEKRLEIIEKEYDAIVDINDKIKDVADSKISLNDALGVAIDNQDNYANLNNSIKAQEDTYNQLTKKLSDYQKEVDSQLSSGYLKKGSEAYQAAMKNIQDFTAKIYDASTSLLELRDKLDQIKIDTIQNVIDGIKRNSDITEKYISYLQSQNRDVPENLYTDRIDNNNAQVQQNLKQMEIYRKKQAVLDVNSKSYQDYAEKIQTLKENTLELITDNESLQDSIYELRFKPLDDAIQKYSDLEDELKSFRDLLNDDAFLDKQGRITEDGLAQVALLQQSIGTAKQKIADYTTGLQKLKESYDNGVISLTEYNDKSKDYREGIQGSIADVKSYQDSLVDLYKNAMSTEVDYLDKIIEKRKSALQAKADYYSYDKSISKKSNDINAIKAQIMALEGVKYLLL